MQERTCINSRAVLIFNRTVENNIHATQQEIQMHLIFSHGFINDSRMILLTGSGFALDEGFLLFAIAFAPDPWGLLIPRIYLPLRYKNQLK